MPLSEIQLRTATIILALPEAAGFALAGGAALVIHEIVDRGTRDLDCFGPSTNAVNQLVDPTLDALAAAGLQTKLMLRADGFPKIHYVALAGALSVTVHIDGMAGPGSNRQVAPVRSEWLSSSAREGAWSAI
jgi:hypothetical protein